VLLANLQLGILPSTCLVSAPEQRLYLDFRLLLGPELQYHTGKHDRMVSARELRWQRPGLLSLQWLLRRTHLSEFELYGLYRRRLGLQLLCSAELARDKT